MSQLPRHLLCWLLILSALGGLPGRSVARDTDGPNAEAAPGPTAVPLPRLETGMHTASIRRIATDDAGRWAVTTSHDKTARIWEVASGRQLAVLRPPQDAGNEGKLFAVAMSPDGVTVAVGGWTQINGGSSASAADGHTIYFFVRASARLLRQIPGLPNVVSHLTWSPDGRWLAASLGGRNGVRLFDAKSGAETGRDTGYGDDSYSADFSPDGSRLVTTCYDGEVRLYAVEAGQLQPLKRARPGGGERPFAARFSPDGRMIAVGYRDSTVVQVLDADDLGEIARPSTAGVDNGNLGRVAWSADGRFLVAGGSWDVGGEKPMRRWPVGDWEHPSDLPLTDGTLMDFAPLPGGGMLFAAQGPTWGVLDGEGRILRRHDGALADFRSHGDALRLSADGRRVRFGYLPWGNVARVFDLATRTLGADLPDLAPARTTEPGLTIENWKDETDPRVNGRPLPLEWYEISRSLAIATDGGHFVLGADWSLRLYRRDGHELWRRRVPSAAWAVNLTADGRFVVAGYGDGTIRWHRFEDGQEVLALFPHADRRRWIAWTPEGFYATSGTDAEQLMGYHLNRGKDREGEFVIVSATQLREQFYQPALISHRLDSDGDRLIVEAVEKFGDVRALLASAASRTPLVEVLGPDGSVLEDAEVRGEDAVRLTVRVRDQGGGIGGLVYYVDGQPTKGVRQAGVVADATDSRSFPLPPGARRIEIAALNRAGIEGPRQIVRAMLTGPLNDTALHILAVGIEHYRQPGLALAHGVADALAVAEAMAARAKPLFKRGVFPKVLKDDEATVAGIEAAFAEMKPRMKPEDTLVIFLAGHGEAPIGKGYTFLTSEYTRDASGLEGEGLSERRLRKLLEQAPSKTLLLLDTCDAGGAVEMIEASYDRLYGVSKHVVIGASRRGEFAREGYRGHGVFTAALLQILQASASDDSDRRLGVVELRLDVDKEVTRIVREMNSAYRQRVSGFLGSANFPVVLR